MKKKYFIYAALLSIISFNFAYAAVELINTEENISFSECKSLMNNLINESIEKGDYNADQVLVAIDTDILIIKKIIGRKYNILMTCSAPDQKMLLQKSTPGDLR